MSWLVHEFHYSEGELRKIVSLTLSSQPILILWQDRGEMTRDRSRCSRWQVVSWCVSLRPICMPQHVPGPTFLHVELVWWFPPCSQLGPGFAYMSRYALTHRGCRTSARSRCPGCGCCYMQTATKSHRRELRVRWGPEWTNYSEEHNMFPHQRYYLFLMP